VHAHRRRQPQAGQLLTGQHMDLSLVYAAHGQINVQVGDVYGLHQRIDHLGDHGILSAPGYLVHAPTGPVEGGVPGHLEDLEHIIRLELIVCAVDELRPLRVQAQSHEAVPIVVGDLSHLFKAPFLIEKGMQIG